jgi:hypothetical protein
MNLIKYIPKIFRREDAKAKKILESIHNETGLWWDNISAFGERMREAGGVEQNSSGDGAENVNEQFPVTHHFEGGLYTREIFMPKGSLVVSLIHKQNHPSFLLEGEVSFINDRGEVNKIKTGAKVFTKIGTQRVLYMHEDTRWVCVYKTDKTNAKDAMKDVYADHWMELPKDFLKKYFKQQKKLLWQECG